MRDKSGRFVKGYSGNTGGRPKDEHNIAELARSYSTEAIDTLVDLMRSAKDDRVRGTAAQALLDRGFGKPKVEIQNTNADFRDALAQVGRVLDERKREEISTPADIVLTSQ
ncbi:HEAT repeat domain-containing protein [bacterium]|nr:HEAT repeat domain-containing protein [bacterium]